MSVLNDELCRLQGWSLADELFINQKKTEYVLFGTQQKLNQINKEMDNQEFQLGKRVSHFKYLGPVV